jgi:5-hydroxyisourate hydrolase
MSTITTHVLDTSCGRPAEGVAVILERQGTNDSWVELARNVTNTDGRITTFLADPSALKSGIYRLRFGTAEYFAGRGLRGFYPEVQVVFHVDDPQGHFHVPLLLSPFGYSTYRGS